MSEAPKAGAAQGRAGGGTAGDATDEQACAARLPGAFLADAIVSICVLASASEAQAQRLWSVKEGAARPRGPARSPAVAASDAFDLEFAPGPFPQAPPAGEVPDCVEREWVVELDGYDVLLCLETPEGERRRAWDYGLDSDRSGLLYFFDRDNVELLVKVLDGCAVNGHRWVFVAPVTDLGFNLVVESPNGGRWTHANRLGRTADAVSDVAAFPCASA